MVKVSRTKSNSPEATSSTNALNSEQTSLLNSKEGVTDFDKLVYEACMNVPKGKVATYGYIAKVIKNPKAYRAVGSALRRNPFAPTVPCHRVVASDRRLGGFYGSTDPNGQLLNKKLKMLVEEGVLLENALDNKSNVSKVRIHESSVLTEAK